MALRYIAPFEGPHLDNVTHTIAGLLVAEALLQTRAGREAPRGFRLAAQLVSALANNMPDFDFVYAGRGLDYLLHHRGHTHTFLIGVPLGLLSLVPVWWWRRKHEPWPARFWHYLIALALLGPVAHLALDYSNNYGVHPFWPLTSRWFYGDAVFIIEPWFWVTALPPLVCTARTRVGKGSLALLLLLVPILAALSGRVPWAIVLGLTACGGAWWLACRRLAPALGVGLGLAGCLVACAAWFGVSAHVRSSLAAELRQKLPNAEIDELVLTPMPGNPLCYSALSVERAGPDYLVRRAVVATVPSLLSAASCPELGSPTAPLEPVPVPSNAAVGWGGQFRAPLTELRALGRACQTAAYLRWSRVPFWTPSVIGDLRYDFSRDRDFAELARDPRCPAHVPGWSPPRARLLAP